MPILSIVRLWNIDDFLAIQSDLTYSRVLLEEVAPSDGEIRTSDETVECEVCSYEVEHSICERSHCYIGSPEIANITDNPHLESIRGEVGYGVEDKLVLCGVILDYRDIGESYRSVDFVLFHGFDRVAYLERG